MKMRPFNLEEALNGAKVVTRNGHEVTQLTKFEGLDNYSLVGVLGGKLTTWTKQGEYYQSEEESHADLFLAVEPQSIWVNVYKFNGQIGLGAIGYTREEAINKNRYIDEYIKTIEITDEL